MKFITDFKSVIEGDASTNAYATGGIKFVHLPEDFDITKNYVVWDFKLNDIVQCINGNTAYSSYGVTITVTATDSVVMNNMEERLLIYLNGIKTANFQDVSFKSDSKITTLSKPANTYQSTLDGTILYVV